MAENSAIEWTDHTWSPWEGCTKVSPGCDHCYAEGMNRWLRKGENWGPGAPRRTYSDAHWAKPHRWNYAAAQAARYVKVFPSVCDPFDNAAPDGERERFARLILATPNLIWLLLTKRIGNAAAMLADMFPGGLQENVWLGATVVNQEEADRDISKLLVTPARVRFLSIEPLLGPVDLTKIPHPNRAKDGPPIHLRALAPNGVGAGIHWAIVGGESGRGARPMRPEWARSLRDQCAAAGVPFLFKQWGEWLGQHQDGNFDHDPLELNASDHPVKVGKKAAGRLLDGVTHDGFPVPA